MTVYLIILFRLNVVTDVMKAHLLLDTELLTNIANCKGVWISVS
uniref:Uncharacterized protein n=1 Tax=Anguilla anguilla TaxID=7936 RepID=A0A0E9TXG2_ANGAN